MHIQSLFLRQSYEDAWDSYQKALRGLNAPGWDDIVLTASNEAQAEAYGLQLEARRSAGMLPKGARFTVLPDPEGLRVGSGGATLNVLRHLAAQLDEPFAGRRTLVVHSGGDSKRVPQYSALGKLFSPVPRALPNGRRSALFDEILIGASGIPARFKEGMLVLSGDVLLLFNALQIEFSGEDAAAISFMEDVETGKDHGVFRAGATGRAERFLHKQSVEQLRAAGAVNERGKVNIDTGAVLLSPAVLNALFGLIATGGRNDDQKFHAFVNERARISFYGDFLYPLAERSTLEQFYHEKPEGGDTEELRACRTKIWAALRPYRMRLLRLSPAQFVHFGTSKELKYMMTDGIEAFRFLDWSKEVSCDRDDAGCSVYNGIVARGANAGPDCYIEDSILEEGADVGRGSIVSGVTVKGRVPENVVLHGLCLKDGRFVARIYGVEDNPKGGPDAPFLGTALSAFLRDNGLTERALWPGGERCIWNARLYAACDTMDGAVAAALNVYDMAHGRGDARAFLAAQRKSLEESFHEADPRALLDWAAHVNRRVLAERFCRLIDRRAPLAEIKAAFACALLDEGQICRLEEAARASDVGRRMRAAYALGRLLGDSAGETHIARSFESIRRAVVEGSLTAEPYDGRLAIQRAECTVRLPLRVNWGGGWSDTPPYCNEHGGTVLNAAISVGGRLPAEAKIERIAEYKVVLESADRGTRGAFTDIAMLQDCRTPYDPFAMHKSALLACGVLPAHGGNLAAILKRLGGGLRLATQAEGIPMGSGLGTSSILAGACVKAIYGLMGVRVCDETVYDRVLCLEQIMSTGGGWQDQIGGVTNGVKLITSEPGWKQRMRVERIDLSPETRGALAERFALIYTGQRRLSRNLLRDIVGKYLENDPQALRVLDEIRTVAVMMSEALRAGDIDAFAALLDKHWALSRALDAGSSNTCIDYIFLSIDDLIAGRMICGAGGGGFLQVILKRGVTRAMLKERLNEVFGDCGVEVWNSEFVFE